MKNRLKEIFAIKQKSIMVDNLIEIGRSIASNEEIALDDEEFKLLKDKIKSEEDSSVLRRLWFLAQFSRYDEDLFQYAKKKLDQKDYIRRDYALSYIGNQKSDLLPWLFENYRNDPNPYVVYELAYLMLKTDSYEAIVAMIEIFSKINEAFDHEIADAIGMCISEYGEKKHTENMKKIIEEDSEYENYWNQWIDYLENK